MHLAKLVAAGLLAVERHGRHRYYRLTGPEVGELLEAIARIAPPAPIRSLQQGTRAQAVRSGRTCYDHLAGRLGTTLMAALLDGGILAGGDGAFHSDHRGQDRLSAPGRGDVDYGLTAHGRATLSGFGVDLSTRAGTSRPFIRYCVDWSEQRHHLAGTLGAALLARLQALDWVRRAPHSRAVHLTDPGRTGLVDTFGVQLVDGG